MTRTKVTRIIRILFFFWLAVSIALDLATIVTLLRLPDQRHEYGEPASSRAPVANGDRQPQSNPNPGAFNQSIDHYFNPPDDHCGCPLTLTSTLSTVQPAVARTDLEFQRLAVAAVWHAGCFHMIARKTPC
jgi:hypothetical protein